jgi:predicted kinase
MPGTGKSSLAERVGCALSIPVFAKDWLEATLRRSGVQPGPDPAQSLGYAGYELLTTLARRQLVLGQSAILDSVASTRSIREQWRALAAEFGAAWRVIECICSDEAMHRALLANRQRGIPGWSELTWAEVERVRDYYAAWDEEHLILDMVAPLAENIRAALAYLRASPIR